MIDAKMVQEVFDEEVVPWCKSNGLKLLIMDNESKFHTKMLVTNMRSKGIEIYSGSGKKPWDQKKKFILQEAMISCQMRENLYIIFKMRVLFDRPQIA